MIEMKMDFVIRKAVIKDLSAVLALNLKLFKKEYKEFDNTLDLKWTHGKGKKYFIDRIQNPNGFVQVIEYKNEIIGYFCGGISERLFYRKKAIYAEMENMFINKEFRGKGLGNKLTKNFLKWCKNKKVDYIAAVASAKNIRAIKLYRRLGFKDYSLTLELKQK